MGGAAEMPQGVLLRLLFRAELVLDVAINNAAVKEASTLAAHVLRDLGRRGREITRIASSLHQPIEKRVSWPSLLRYSSEEDIA
jgi:hypothetical protein